MEVRYYVNRYRSKKLDTDMVQIICRSEKDVKDLGWNGKLEQHRKGSVSFRGTEADMTEYIEKAEMALTSRERMNFRMFLTSDEYPMLGAWLLKAKKKLNRAGLRTVIGMTKEDVGIFIRAMLAEGLINGTFDLTPAFRKEMREWDRLTNLLR